MNEVWPLRPIYPGPWAQPNRVEAEEILRAILATESGEILFKTYSLRGLRSISPSFYPDFKVVEFLLDTNAPPRSAVYIIGRELLVSMNGTSPPIHELNAAIGLHLNEGKQARDYLHFFCTCVCGDEGSFSILENNDDVIFAREGNDRVVELGSSSVRPFVVLPSADEEKPGFSAKATIRYSNAIFLQRSSFTLAACVRCWRTSQLKSIFLYKLKDFGMGFGLSGRRA